MKAPRPIPGKRMRAVARHDHHRVFDGQQDPIRNTFNSPKALNRGVWRRISPMKRLFVTHRGSGTGSGAEWTRGRAAASKPLDIDAASRSVVWCPGPAEIFER